MLTPDQVRLRIEHLRSQPHEASCWDLLNLIEELFVDMADENARLRRALRLSEASRGVLVLSRDVQEDIEHIRRVVGQD